ncbi:unnamed protein product [Closterium sp. NIES-64]|nr:unnamed protein product [Closterium sp. NIES-64]
MYAVTGSDEDDCYRCFPPDPGIGTAESGTSEAAALGASASVLSGAGESALSVGRLRCPWLTPLGACPVSLLHCPPVSGGPLWHPDWSLPPLVLDELVSGADLQDAGVHQFTPARQRVTHCTEADTGRHLATFTRRPGSSLYTLTTASPPGAESGRVPSSGQVFAAASRSGPESAPCSCRRLSHETLLWHHRLGHPSLLRLRGMASRVLVSGLPRSLPPLPPGPGPTCVPCVEGRQRAAPHSSQFPPTEAPLQTLHMDVWGPARVSGQGQERYFLLVVDDYSRYTTVFPLRSKVYHPTSRRVLSSQDVTFDESVPTTASSPTALRPSPHPRFLVDAVEPVEVTGDSGAAAGAEPGGAASGGAEPGGAEPGGAEPGGAEPGGAEPGGAEPGVLSLGVLSLGVLCLGVLSLGVLRLGVLSLEVRAWGSCVSGLPAAGGCAAGAGGSSAAEGTAASRPAVLVLWVLELLGSESSPGAGATEGVGAEPAVGGPTDSAPGAAAGGSGASGGAAGGAAGVGTPAGAAGTVPAVSGVAARPRPYFVPLLQQVLLSVVSLRLVLCRLFVLSALVVAGRASASSSCPWHAPDVTASVHCSSACPFASPPASSLPALADPESDSLRAASPTVTRLLATAVTDPSFESSAASALVTELVDFAARCRLDYAARLVTEQEEFQCLAAASPRLASVLLAPEGDPDAPDIPTPRSYAEAIEGPYSSQWQAAMDAEMASWKSTGTYVDAVPPPGANIVSGMWIFRVKRPRVLRLSSRRVTAACTRRSGCVAHTGFTGSFPPGTQWSLRRPVYGLRQAPREWHDTLRTTLAALGFAPSTADPSLFLRTDTSLPPFYILVYVDDLVFATADTAGLAYVKSELQKRHTCTDLGELRSYLGLQITRDRARRTITLTQSHMVQQVLQRFGFTYSSPQATPLPTRHSLSALPSMKHMAAAKRVLRYLCSTSGMGLVLGGRSPVVLTGHADASWADDQATQRSSQGYTFSLGSALFRGGLPARLLVLGSSCEAEIYAGAMAAQELHWLTYL